MVSKPKKICSSCGGKGYEMVAVRGLQDVKCTCGPCSGTGFVEDNNP